MRALVKTVAYGALGLAVVAVAAVLVNAVSAGAPLFAQSRDVPSVSVSAASAQWAAAVERARPIVRAAIVEQNLPGISVAVGISGVIVWAEGFGWRDVGTRTPVTSATRFNIGSAASAVTAAVAPIGLVNTGAESAVAWSPEQIGEPGEDFPLFTMARHLIFQPLGLAPAEYPLPGDRATFYVPRSDDHDPRRGRRLMSMRDLACCVDGKAFYSTPSDLVRFALATNADSVNGDLAGGSVMSLMTRRDNGTVVAVTSNVAYANTAALALKVAEVFAVRK
jgi:CubicO group peptidase (beta-lactamase class C family)